MRARRAEISLFSSLAARYINVLAETRSSIFGPQVWAESSKIAPGFEFVKLKSSTKSESSFSNKRRAGELYFESFSHLSNNPCHDNLRAKTLFVFPAFDCHAKPSQEQQKRQILKKIMAPPFDDLYRAICATNK